MASKSNWFARHKVLTAIIILIVLIAIGSSASKGSNTNINTTASNKTGSTKTSSNTKPAADAHVGATIDIGGSQGLAVTLQQVIDPATSDNEFATPAAGKRFVAVKLAIQNNGKSSYEDDANNNATIIGSDNQSYTADFDTISGCTNFSSGQYTLATGESATGCVVFQVPNGVNPAKLQFKASSGFGSTGKWLIP